MPRALLLAAISCSCLALLPPSAKAAEPDGPASLMTRADATRIALQDHLSKLHAKSDQDNALVQFYSDPNQGLLWVDQDGVNERGKAVIAEIGKADSYGLRPAAYSLPKLDAAAADKPGVDALADAEMKISVAVLSYARDARGGRLNPSHLSENLDPTLNLPDPVEVLDSIAIRSDPAAYLRSFEPQQPQFEVLRHKLMEAKGSGGASQRLLVNMERWRWLPDDLGSFYVMVNLPEFMVRVVEDGKVIHTARVVVGKPDKQTPVFTQDMQEIVFNPFWNVPNSIKTEEILPYMGGGLFGYDTSILQRHNLHVNYGGREVDPGSLDWGSVDARNVEIFEPPGGDNPLGKIKFVFPNKHDVYMHDTTQKELFAEPVRAESHGCMRVQNPDQLADVLLGHDQNWSPAKVSAALANGYDQHVKLDHQIPVYVTYFTDWVNDDGSVSTFSDIYGHDARMSAALLGKPIAPDPSPQVAQSDQPRQKHPQKRRDANTEIARALFGF